MANIQPSTSPKWGTTTKLAVSLTVIFLLGALVFRFHTIIVPVLMAFIVAYLLHPLASKLHKKVHLSWRMAVSLIYLVVVLIIIALLVWGGVGLVGQIQNLITSIQTYISDLPATIDNLSHEIFIIGPFHIDLTSIDWQTIGQQVMTYIEPTLGKAGDLVAALAGSAFTTLGWMAFVILVSFFFLLESGLNQGILILDIPGYTEDLRLMGEKLTRIWNAFLRGQIVIFISKFIIYLFILGILGVRYTVAIALVGGFASFLPYIGPTITWIVMGLVTFYQGSTVFGLSPFAYMLMTILTMVVVDQAFDSLVVPRIMAQALKVHPAFVLISAIIAANLLGIVGVILAAPLLATLQLVGRYILRKLLNQEPWQPEDDVIPPSQVPRWLRRLRTWLRMRQGGKDSTPVTVKPAKGNRGKAQ
jgi:predicted PurR-regulated permease PerM